MNLSGDWLGSGQSVMRPNSDEPKARPCSEIGFQFRQTENEFKILNGYYLCQDLSAEYPPASFQIQNKEIFYRGQKIGAVSEDGAITITWYDASDDSTFLLNLKLSNSALIYHEEWFQSGVSQLIIRGSLELIGRAR